VNAWREEVLAVSDVVQDGDESVPDSEREARFNRFVALVSDVEGNEDDAVFFTLLETLTDQEDYGAYEAVFGALSRFPPERRGSLAAHGASSLLARAPELAGDLLSQIAFSRDGTVDAFTEEFSRIADAEERGRMTAFIAEQERGAGWLDHDDKRGQLRFS
jgi:hypothetical protein